MSITQRKILRSVTFSVSQQAELMPWAMMRYVVEIWDDDKFISCDSYQSQVETLEAKKQIANTPIMEI